jgi:hypothetical protein
MDVVDIDRIKAQVVAARAALPREPLPSGNGRLEIRSNEPAAALLRSHLEKTGLDLQALERAGGAEAPPTLLKPSPEAAQAHARRLAGAAKVRRGQRQAARAAAERDGRALPPWESDFGVQPSFIFATPAGFLVEDQLHWANNWAKVEIVSTEMLGNANVGFFFIWTNSSEDTIGLSVDTQMGFLGSCSVWAKRGFTGGISELDFGGALYVYAGESDVLRVAETEVVFMEAESSGFWLDSRYKVANVDADIYPCYDLLTVPAGGTVVVEAHAWFSWVNHNGQVMIDFAGPHSQPASARVSCPFMDFIVSPIIT